jgi:hypothetical protein
MGMGPLEVSPNGLESKPNPFPYKPNNRSSKQLLDKEAYHKPSIEVQVV